jgi:hypothetical protein
VIHDSPTFCRIVVIDRHDEVLVDLAVDSPPQVLAQMMTTLDRFSDDEIPASAEVVPERRLFFARWARELSHD